MQLHVLAFISKVKDYLQLNLLNKNKPFCFLIRTTNYSFTYITTIHILFNIQYESNRPKQIKLQVIAIYLFYIYAYIGVFDRRQSLEVISLVN